MQRTDPGVGVARRVPACARSGQGPVEVVVELVVELVDAAADDPQASAGAVVPGMTREPRPGPGRLDGRVCAPDRHPPLAGCLTGGLAAQWVRRALRIFLLAAEATWEQECHAPHVVGLAVAGELGAASGLVSDRVAVKASLPWLASMIAKAPDNPPCTSLIQFDRVC